jgi:LuxR family maltose regulon positive regulatory protein
MYLRWLGKIPEDYLPPTLALHQLFFLHEMGEFKTFDRCLLRVEEQLGPPPARESGQTSIQHGILFVIKGIRRASFFIAEEAWEHFHNALRLLPEKQSFWRVLALGGYGFCKRVNGNASEAITHYEHAVAMALEGNLTFCFFMYSIALAKLYLEHGQLEQASRACQALLDYNTSDDGKVPFSGLAHIVMGQVHYHSGELLQAEKYIEHGLGMILKDGDVFSIVDAYLSLAECLLGLRKPDESIEAMDEMSAIINHLSPSQAVTIIAESFKTLIQILNGRPDLAHRSYLESDSKYLAEKRYPDLFPLKFQGIYRTSQHSLTFYSNAIHFINAKLAIETNKAKDAFCILSELVANFNEKTTLLFKSEVLIQMALAHRLLGHEKQAQTSLEEAIAIVAPENYCQIFIREGRPLYELLKQIENEQKSYTPEVAHFITHTMTKMPSSGVSGKSQHSPFDLTPREVEVLTFLAEGTSYKETAAQLFVSVNTLKTHAKRIYSKLGVGNRTQAVNKAKELNIFLP